MPSDARRPIYQAARNPETPPVRSRILSPGVLNLCSLRCVTRLFFHELRISFVIVRCLQTARAFHNESAGFFESATPPA